MAESHPSLSHVHPTHHINTASHPCPGFKYSWDLGNIFDTYPFSIHRPGSQHDPGYIIPFADPIAAAICVRATHCERTALILGGSCRSRMGLGPCIDSVRNRALQPFGKRSTARLNRNQLEQKLVSVSRQLKNEQLKVCLISKIIGNS